VEAAKAAETEESEIAAAIRKTLHAITAESPLTIRKATQIERISKASLPLLRAVSGVLTSSEHDLSEMWGSQAEVDLESLNSENSSEPLASSTQAETHATTVIREVIAMVPHFLAMQHSNPFELVRAVAHAEACGMTGLAAKLRSQLGIKNPEEPTPPGPDFLALSPPKTRAEGEIRYDDPTLASESENGTDPPSAVFGEDEVAAAGVAGKGMGCWAEPVVLGPIA
jgi:hypothetical protein